MRYVYFRPVTAALQTASIRLFILFFPLSEALGTINPTDYSAPLLLDWTFTISRGRQQWGPDESNIHGISFTLLPLSHAPPPLCQAPVWWEGLLTLAAPIDRQFCKDGPQQPQQTLRPLSPSFAPKCKLIGGPYWNPRCLICGALCVFWALGVQILCVCQRPFPPTSKNTICHLK